MKSNKFSDEHISDSEERVIYPFFRKEQNSIIMREKLKDLGWKELARGFFSSVFYNPKKSYVLKVTTLEDKGYAAYVNLIKNTQINIFQK